LYSFDVANSAIPPHAQLRPVTTMTFLREYDKLDRQCAAEG
jgi:hypothetical protein